MVNKAGMLEKSTVNELICHLYDEDTADRLIFRTCVPHAFMFLLAFQKLGNGISRGFVRPTDIIRPSLTHEDS